MCISKGINGAVRGWAAKCDFCEKGAGNPPSDLFVYVVTLSETSSSPLETDDWKMIRVLFGMAYVQGDFC